MFCGSCGNPLHELAIICPKCGMPTKNYQAQNAAGPRRGASGVGDRFPVASSPATSGLATVSLVLGLVGLVLAVTAIPAIICGHLARGKIRGANGTLVGDGMALAGLIMGYATIAFFIVLLPAIAIPSFFNARNASQSNACINNMRQIDGAQQQAMLALGTDAPTADQVQRYLKQANPVCPSTGKSYDISKVPPACPSNIARHVLP